MIIALGSVLGNIGNARQTVIHRFEFAAHDPEVLSNETLIEDSNLWMLVRNWTV